MTCKERVRKAWHGTIKDLRRIWKDYLNGGEEIFNYGLGFDYVPSGTFKDQEEPYFRWQFSWGGPSDELRFFVGPDLKPYRIEYWFLDWFDGASIEINGKDFDLLSEIFQEFFVETGTARALIEEAEND